MRQKLNKQEVKTLPFSQELILDGLDIKENED